MRRVIESNNLQDAMEQMKSLQAPKGEIVRITIDTLPKAEKKALAGSGTDLS